MNRKNLRKRVGGGYAVVYNVPKGYQDLVGRREIVRGLGTPDEKEAMRLKAAKLLEIQAEVHRLVNGHREDTFSLMREAGERSRDRREMGHYRDTLAAYDQQTTDRAESIADRDDTSSRAHRYAEVALGRSTPISVAAEEWRSLWRGTARRTQEKYEHTLRLFQDYFGDCSIDEITRRKAIKYVEHLKATPSKRTGKPLSPKSIKTEITTLGSFFNVCIERGLLPRDHENPFEKIRHRLPGQKEEAAADKRRPVTRQEADRFLAACDNANRPAHRALGYSYEMRALIRLLWVTGARANEIASLTRETIKDEGDLIWLRVEDAKTPAGNRWLCLVGEPERELVREALAEADKVLAEVDENGKPVVPEENRQLLFPRLRRGGADRHPYWMIQKALGKVRKDIFGEDIEWDMHSFRRNAVAALVDAGVPVHERNLVLGHSNTKDIGMAVYAKEADLWKAVERTMRVLYEELGGSLNG